MATKTTLDGAIGFADPFLTVADELVAADSPSPLFALIDAEYVRIINGTGARRWLVERGALNTARTGHEDGAEVTVLDQAVIDRDEVANDSLPNAEVDFIEQAGAGTYTGTVTQPAGTTITAVQFGGIVAFDADTAAIDVGDDDDAKLFFDGEDLQAAAGKDLIADLTAAIDAGALYTPVARTITAVVTTTGDGGDSGRAKLLVAWVYPASSATAAYAPAG